MLTINYRHDEVHNKDLPLHPPFPALPQRWPKPPLPARQSEENFSSLHCCLAINESLPKGICLQSRITFSGRLGRGQSHEEGRLSRRQQEEGTDCRKVTFHKSFIDLEPIKYPIKTSFVYFFHQKVHNLRGSFFLWKFTCGSASSVGNEELRAQSWQTTVETTIH